MIRIVNSKHSSVTITKILLLVVCALFLVINSSYTNNLSAQNLEEVRYYKEVEKNQYYIHFINEIPYFLVNMYEEYFEVILVEGKIVEANLYENGSVKKRWNYSYPDNGIMRIDYHDSIVVGGIDDQENVDDIISDRLVSNYDVFYYDMGLLVRKEHYEDGDLRFYFDIDYDKSGKITREYYFKANDVQMYKFFNYKNDILRCVTRKGIIKDDKTKQNTIINERWIYKNKRISELEKYDGTNLKEKFYYNNIGNIVKKELYNELQRIERFYRYGYRDDMTLLSVKEFIPNDPLSSEVTNSFIVKAYDIEKESFKISEYAKSLLEKETVIHKDRNNVTEKTYDANGDIVNIDSYKIITDYTVDGYNSDASAVKYSISHENLNEIISTDESKKDIKLVLSDDYNLIYTADLYSESGELRHLVYNSKNGKIVEKSYNELGQIQETKRFIVLSDYDEYISSLRIDPVYDILLFPPDK